MTSFFPSVLKTAKAVPAFKKDSKLDYSRDFPISLLSNIGKIFEKPTYFIKLTYCIKYIPSSITIKLSITYSFDSDNSIVHPMP